MREAEEIGRLVPRSGRDLPQCFCLRALWILSEGNVKEVPLRNPRPRAYTTTTIMTVLEHLVRKG
jgi:hypothetical protein